MRERDNHIATVDPSVPMKDYSCMVMVSRSLMERCSPEGRWRPAAAATALEAAAALGAAALGRPSSLEMVLVWGRVSTSRWLPWRRKIRDVL